jgi:hypothetical protein
MNKLNVYTISAAVFIAVLFFTGIIGTEQASTAIITTGSLIYGAHFSIGLAAYIAGHTVLSRHASDAVVDITKTASRWFEQAAKRPMLQHVLNITVQVLAIVFLFLTNHLWTGLLAMCSVFTFAIATQFCAEQYNAYCREYGEDAE